MNALRSLFAGSVLAVAASSVMAGEPFTVNEASVVGLNCVANVCNQVTADKINGEYTEVITFGAGGTFVSTAFGEMTQLVNNNLASRLGAVPGFTGTAYGMYALFTASGTVTPGGVFTGITGTVDLYIDGKADTTNIAPATGAGSFTLGNTSDDYKIAFADSVYFGYGQVVPGVGGFFDIRFDDVALTAAGMGYFIDPNPFYVRATLDGDLDDFALTGTQTIVGDVSVEFAVPEPGSLALVGLALLGLGTARRRKA